jgi:putative polyhydroxyalkanoate system protein
MLAGDGVANKRPFESYVRLHPVSILPVSAHLLNSPPALRRGRPYTSRMATISIARKHALSHKKAKGVAEKIAKDLKKRYDLDYEWNGDRIEFERSGVNGHLSVGNEGIALEVSLGWLLTPFKPAIEREITAQLDKLLGQA